MSVSGNVLSKWVVPNADIPPTDNQELCVVGFCSPGMRSLLEVKTSPGHVPKKGAVAAVCCIVNYGSYLVPQKEMEWWFEKQGEVKPPVKKRGLQK